MKNRIPKTLLSRPQERHVLSTVVKPGAAPEIAAMDVMAALIPAQKEADRTGREVKVRVTTELR